jgi:glycerophosphoryl diester phosphodiesterase
MPFPRGRFVPWTSATTKQPLTTIAFFTTAVLLATTTATPFSSLFARAFVITTPTIINASARNERRRQRSNLPLNLLLAAVVVSSIDDSGGGGDNPSTSNMMHRYAARYSHSQSFQEALEVVNDDVDVDESNNDNNDHDHDNIVVVVVVGHRGSPYEYMENTLAGFRRCFFELQCSMELDVYELANDDEDGTLVVFHGGDQGRLYPQIIIDDVERNIRNVSSLAELNALSFNVNYEGYVCPPEQIVTAQIPTLRQVLELLSSSEHDQDSTNNTSKMTIKLELKAGGPRFVQRAIALLHEFSPTLIAKCTFSSFHHPYLHEIHAFNNHNDDKNNEKKTRYNYYRTAALFDAPLPVDFLDRAINCDEVHLRYDTCTVSTIAAAHERGYQTMAWLCGPIAMHRDLTTKWYNNNNNGDGDNDDPANHRDHHHHIVGEEALYGTLLKTGVQQICCNKPRVLLEMLASSRKSKLCSSSSSSSDAVAEEDVPKSTNG